MKRTLIRELNKYIKIDECMVYEEECVDETITQLKVRDALLKVGYIYEEIKGMPAYVASINSGFFNQNKAFLAVAVEGKTMTVIGYAHEGIIKQHTLEKAMKVFKKSLGVCQ